MPYWIAPPSAVQVLDDGEHGLAFLGRGSFCKLAEEGVTQLLVLSTGDHHLLGHFVELLAEKAGQVFNCEPLCGVGAALLVKLMPSDFNTSMGSSVRSGSYQRNPGEMVPLVCMTRWPLSMGCLAIRIPTATAVAPNQGSQVTVGRPSTLGQFGDGLGHHLPGGCQFRLL